VSHREKVTANGLSALGRVTGKVQVMINTGTDGTSDHLTILKQSTKQQNGRRAPSAWSGAAAVSKTTGDANDGQRTGRKLHCHNV